MRRISILLSLLLFACNRHGTEVQQAIVDPNPVLAAAVKGATQLEFECGRFVEEEKRIVRITDAAEIEAFLTSIELERFPEGSYVHCMCAGDPQVIVQAGSVSIAEFTIHHSHSIRWGHFETDLELTHKSRARLGEFLKRHNIDSE